MSKVVSVGLVGYGMAGRVFHAPLISSVPGLRLVSVVERHGETSRERYPDVAVVKDAFELFYNEGIDLVVIAAPNAAHYELARAALLSGKHVVADKPFTVLSSEARELIDLAKNRHKILSVFQNRRWDGDFLTVSQIARTQRVGRLVEFASSFDRFRPGLKPGAWREQPGPGAGVLYDIGPHLIDQALALFGMPKSLRADIRIQRDSGTTDDQFEVVLQYEALAVRLGAGMLAREPRPRFLLRGTRGSFVKHSLDPQEDALRRGGTPRDKGWGVEEPARWGTIDTCESPDGRRETVETLPGRYQAFYENVYDAIVNGAALVVTPEQARDVVRIIELAMESSREGRTVEVPA
ncbi:MAG TPA: oxidoreductase [Chitinivibrionales bacterium]|jgi:predicted dehydrogenase|nr:oxidoreductase [Chitinivibrionales bacterium]